MAGIVGGDEKSNNKRKRITEDNEEGPSRSKVIVTKGRVQRITDDYVNLAGEFMCTSSQLGQFGFDPSLSRFPINRINALGYLLSPLRRSSVAEKWNPFEIAVFEAALTLYGKNFNQVQKMVKTKSVKEIIEFYYDWKKSSHYKQWKKVYIPDERDITDEARDPK